jgi:PAS domain S-box-containing protein
MKMAVKAKSVRRPDDKNHFQKHNLSHLAKAIISNVGVGIYIIQHGKFIYVSQLYQKLTGYSEAELIGTYSLNNIYPDDRKMVREEAIKCLKEERFEPYEYRFVKKNYDVMWVLETITPIVYEGERATLGSFMDITERKKVEEKLRHEEKRFRALAEQSSDIIVLVNRKGIITYENQAVERYLGLKVEERIGAGVFERIHPDDLKLSIDTFNTLSGDINAPDPHFEIRLRHRNGSWHTFELVGSKMIHDNVVEYVIINLRDITERKMVEESLRQSEEKYRTILENIQEGYFEVDLAGNFTFFSDSTCLLLGYSKEELLGMNYQQFTNTETSKKSFSNV